MTTKPLLLLAVLTLCCSITSLHALQRTMCLCIRTSPARIPIQAIKKIEVIPISGHCRRTEIIITRRNNKKVCVNPNTKWVIDLLSNVQSINATTAAPFI